MHAPPWSGSFDDSSFCDSSQLHIFTGKGGVGKSATAALWARKTAQLGKRTLAIELAPAQSLWRFLAGSKRPCPPIGQNVAVQPAHLEYLSIDARTALEEYGRRTLKIARLSQAVFGHGWVRRFTTMLPGLQALLVLGKIAHHCDERFGDGNFLYENIVWDAPATGHGLAYIQAPKAAAQALPKGPVRAHAEAMDELLREPKRTQIHAVVCGQAMAVDEAKLILETCMAAGLPLGRCVVQRTTHPMATDAALRWQTWINTQRPDDIAGKALAQWQREAQMGQEALAKLGQDVLGAAIWIPSWLQSQDGTSLEPDEALAHLAQRPDILPELATALEEQP